MKYVKMKIYSDVKFMGSNQIITVLEVGGTNYSEIHCFDLRKCLNS